MCALVEGLADVWRWVPPLVCFFIGSVPCGFLIGSFRGVDLRREGSGNIGATNAFRVLGPGWGSLVFLLDFAKGFLPIWWLSGLGDFVAAWQASAGVDAGLLLCSLAVVLGHNHTPFLGFRGGKGIASSAGILLALLPGAFLLAALVWGMVFVVSRIVSVASLAASAALPLAAWLSAGHRPMLVGLCVLLALASFWRHRSNIGRLLSGTEPSFRGRAKPAREGEGT